MGRTPHPHPHDETSPGAIATATEKRPLRVVIVGALEWARRDLADALRNDGGGIEPFDGGDANALRLPAQTDVLLFDARVAPDEVLLLLERLRRRDWAVPCVVIAPRQDEDIVIEAIRLGANDIVHPPLAGAGLAGLLLRLAG